jgi:hydroxyethylthiazole kinase
MLTEEELRAHIAEAVETVRATNPMAPSITNFVTIDYVANAQLAVGGSAAMVFLPDEGEFLAGSPAMYLNLGTLMPVHKETIPRTARALHEHGTPWVLDPVGIGIGSLRTTLIDQCRDCKPSIIRCNASEAIALAQAWDLGIEAAATVRGVDAMDSVEEARQAAIALARFTGGAIAVSGEIDLVTDGEQVVLVPGGSEFMTYITGSGCSLGGVAAIYAACSTPFVAALTATAIYNLAGIRASLDCEGPASFKVAFLDELYSASSEDVSQVPFVIQEA